MKIKEEEQGQDKEINIWIVSHMALLRQEQKKLTWDLWSCQLANYDWPHTSDWHMMVSSLVPDGKHAHQYKAEIAVRNGVLDMARDDDAVWTLPWFRSWKHLLNSETHILVMAHFEAFFKIPVYVIFLVNCNVLFLSFFPLTKHRPSTSWRQFIQSFAVSCRFFHVLFILSITVLN